MKIIAVSDEGSVQEPLWIVTVEVFSNQAVDVKVNGTSGLIYIMQNEDGSEVYNTSTGKTYPCWPFCVEKAVDLVKFAYSSGFLSQKTAPARISAERYKQIAFQALQLLRSTVRTKYYDWKDADDWLFAEMDLEAGEVEEIYSGYFDMVYTGSCFADGESPKNYDKVHFDEKTPSEI